LDFEYYSGSSTANRDTVHTNGAGRTSGSLNSTIAAGGADWWCDECMIVIEAGSLGINVVEPTGYSPAYRVHFSYFTGAVY
jgi:hypothetical protein